jgi:hypothetical protein
LTQLAEKHGQELPPAGETTGVTLSFVLLYGLLKLSSRKQLEYLGENAAYSTQGGFLLGFDCFAKTNLRQRGSALLRSQNLIWTSLVRRNRLYFDQRKA